MTEVYRGSNRLDPLGLRTLDFTDLMKRKVDSSLYMTFSHSASVQCLYFLQKASLFLTMLAFSKGF